MNVGRNDAVASEFYEHPGYLFLSRYELPCDKDGVIAYAQFLLTESGIANVFPTDFSKIYERFNVPIPRRAPLPDQQGILIDSSGGIIIINENDPLVRQRFTEGHELTELLFAAIEEKGYANQLPCWMWEKKEHLCDHASAELLMPQLSFSLQLRDLGTSIETARFLTTLYKTSLLSTLIRMVELTHVNCALVMWCSSFKPSELKRIRSASRSDSFSYESKLRIKWAVKSRNWSGGYLPPHKSIPYNSIIGCAYTTEEPYLGEETIFLGATSLHCQLEAVPLRIDNELCVISLLWIAA